MFGEFTCKIDSKGRMRLPKELLSQLSGGGGGTQALFLLHGKGKQFLKLFTEAEFNEKIAKAKRLNPDNSKHYRLLQLLFQGAQRITIDSADRINIPKLSTEFAGLHNEVVVSAFFGQIEIWSAEEYWKDALSVDPAEQDRLQAEIFGEETALPAPEAIDDLTETPPAG